MSTTKTNAILISHNKANNPHVLGILNSYNWAVEEIEHFADYVRVTFIDPEYAANAEKLMKESLGRIHHDDLMLAKA